MFSCKVPDISFPILSKLKFSQQRLRKFLNMKFCATPSNRSGEFVSYRRKGSRQTVRKTDFNLLEPEFYI